jgi:hypothetical protein
VYRGANTALTHRRLVYDAFGRLVRVAAVDGMDETDIALYRYNGLNMRLMWQDDADADSTLESSERFYVMHDGPAGGGQGWRPVATFRDTDSTPKEAFVWHAAGAVGIAHGGTALQSGGSGGFGGASYIDSLILRERDNYTSSTPNPMTSASDGTLEERRYFCQNWRADVVAVTKSDGTPIEYVRYSAYGEPTVYPVADLNMDGVVNSTDSTLWSDLLYSTSNASVYADSDLDFDGLGRLEQRRRRQRPLLRVLQRQPRPEWRGPREFAGRREPSGLRRLPVGRHDQRLPRPLPRVPARHREVDEERPLRVHRWHEHGCLL